MGYMQTRIHRELKDDEIKQICHTYHTWQQNTEYKDILGYCRSVDISEIAKNDYMLTPGRYVGINNDEPSVSEETLSSLQNALEQLFEQSRHLEQEILRNLKEISDNHV